MVSFCTFPPPLLSLSLSLSALFLLACLILHFSRPGIFTFVTRHPQILEALSLLVVPLRPPCPLIRYSNLPFQLCRFSHISDTCAQFDRSASIEVSWCDERWIGFMSWLPLRSYPRGPGRGKYWHEYGVCVT